MSDNNIKINYSTITFPPSSIDAGELDRLQRLDKNIQAEIKRLRDYIYEADNLSKHVSFISKDWLDITINRFEKRIRELERFYK